MGRDPFRLLVVDDDPDLRETLCEVLGSEGYEVSSASTGREALEKLRASTPPDLILLDVVMPDMDGRKLFHTLQRDPSLRGVRVLGLTGTPGKKALPCPTISKPVGLDFLLRSVAAALRTPRRSPQE
jgi:CheY-like chemotaxis protein